MSVNGEHSDGLPAWWRDAACTGMDPDLFFPERGDNQRDAKAACSGCPVRSHCLDHALRHNEMWGIWGGLSRLERLQIRRRQRRGAA